MVKALQLRVAGECNQDMRLTHQDGSHSKLD